MVKTKDGLFSWSVPRNDILILRLLVASSVFRPHYRKPCRLRSEASDEVMRDRDHLS